MRSPAKFAAPVVFPDQWISPVVDMAFRGRLSLFTAPSGYLPTSQIATLAHRWDTPLIWLRAGEEDRDPGVLLTSLISALQKIEARAGSETLAAMRRQPGPVSGWAPLFAAAAREYAAALPDGALLAIEHAGKLSGSSCLELLGAHFLPLLPEPIVVMITSHEPLPPRSFPLQPQQFRERDLQINAQTGWDALNRMRSSLTDQALHRAITLGEGRVGLLENLGQASQVLDPALVARNLDESRSLDDLLMRLTRAWVGALPPGASYLAQMAVQLNDFHPEMMRSVINAGLPDAPSWLQPLDGGWQRVLCSWQPPLRLTLKTLQRTEPLLLGAVARALLAEGLTDQAVRVYLSLGDYPNAAEVISGIAPAMLDIGQWQTLEDWLSQMPESVQHNWPWLVYAGGELATTRHEGALARRQFALSTALFRQQRSPEGICQSLLTESVLAAWQGETDQALTYAHAARSEAREANLLIYQAYANWQAGCLQAGVEQFSTALMYFDECQANAQQANAPLVADLAQQVKDMIRQRLDLDQQSLQYRHALAALDVAQQDVANSIQAVLSSPANNLGLLLAERGWSHTPLNLKSPAFEIPPPEPRGLNALWQGLLSVFRFPNRERVPPDLLAQPPAPAGVEPAPAAQADLLPVAQPENVPDDDPRPVVAGGSATLTVYLLGPFQVLINDTPLTTWSSGRGRSLFQYLLAHHNRPRTREELMAIFWPETAEKAARNNLNVAVHALRQALRQVSDLNVVVYHEGVYRINPQIDLWLDVDVFEQALAQARQADAAGDQDATIHALEAATNIYRDDFASSDPYEEWTLPVRERLRLAYMEALDRLSSLYFDRSQYAAAASLCQRLLARDACREDAHCRLMLCYTRMGERHLALRQFQICADALRAELNTAPSPATLQLFQKIRRQE
ncbi:MAG TPA: BTAD domain-containing putative transcriptional regulator [Anaerolineaceae bacterium]